MNSKILEKLSRIVVYNFGISAAKKIGETSVATHKEHFM
jgi:hypothetical protein